MFLIYHRARQIFSPTHGIFSAFIYKWHTYNFKLINPSAKNCASLLRSLWPKYYIHEEWDFFSWLYIQFYLFSTSLLMSCMNIAKKTITGIVFKTSTLTVLNKDMTDKYYGSNMYLISLNEIFLCMLNNYTLRTAFTVQRMVYFTTAPISSIIHNYRNCL